MFGRKPEHNAQELVQIVTLEEFQQADRILKNAISFRRAATEVEREALEAFEQARKQHQQAMKVG